MARSLDFVPNLNLVQSGRTSATTLGSQSYLGLSSASRLVSLRNGSKVVVGDWQNKGCQRGQVSCKLSILSRPNIVRRKYSRKIYIRQHFRIQRCSRASASGHCDTDEARDVANGHSGKQDYNLIDGGALAADSNLKRRSEVAKEAIFEVENLVRVPSDVLDSLQSRLDSQDLETVLNYFGQNDHDWWCALEIYGWMHSRGRVVPSSELLMQQMCHGWLKSVLSSHSAISVFRSLVAEMQFAGIKPLFRTSTMVVIMLWDVGQQGEAIAYIKKIQVWNEEMAPEGRVSVGEDSSPSLEDDAHSCSSSERSQIGSKVDDAARIDQQGSSIKQSLSPDKVEALETAGEKAGLAGPAGACDIDEAESDHEGMSEPSQADAEDGIEDGDLGRLLVSRLIDKGNAKEAVYIARRLRGEGAEVSLAVYGACLLAAVMEQEAFSTTKRELKHLEKEQKIVPLDAQSNASLDAYEERLQCEAEQILAWAVEDSGPLENGMGAMYEKLVALYCVMGDGKRAEQALAAAMLHGRAVNADIFNAVAGVCGFSADDEAMLRVLKLMEEAGQKADTRTLYAIIGGCMRGQHYESAAACMIVMLAKGVRPTVQLMTVLMQALQKQGNAGAYLRLCSSLARAGLIEPCLLYLYIDALNLTIVRMMS